MVTISFLTVSFTSIAQTDFLSFTKPDPKYRDCAAIFFDGKYLVDDIVPKGKYELFPNMAGPLTSASVIFTNDGTEPIKDIAFQIAIKNNRTSTIWMFTKEAVLEIYLQDIIEKCEPGDSLIIMPADQQYPLSQHEIVLIWAVYKMIPRVQNKYTIQGFSHKHVIL